MTIWIWETFLVTSLLVVAVLAVRRLVALLFGPTVAYWLWLLPAARLFMPSLEREITVPAATPLPAAPAETIAPLAEAAPAIQDSAISSLTAMAPAAEWMQIGVILWLGGAALIFMVQTLRYVSMRDALIAGAQSLGRVDGVRLIESDSVGGPLAFGLFKRYIVVPQNFARIFSAEEREMALAHEMAHHRSGDLFANLAAFTFLCLTWFNPFSWLAWSAFRFDQEAACDARVLEGRDAKSREIYGRTLARVANDSTHAAHDRVPTFATALNSPKTIIARLRNLTMKDISKNRRLLGKLGVFAAVGVALPLTATIVTVPVAAHDTTVIVTDGQSKKKTKTKIITHGIFVDEAGDDQTPFVKTIEKDGRTIVLRTSKKLSKKEIKKMVEDAEASRVEADKAMESAEGMRIEIEEEAEKARDHAKKHRIKIIEKSRSVHVIRGKDGKKRTVMSIRNTRGDGQNISNSKSWQMDGDFVGAMVPEIKISHVKTKCDQSKPVSIDVRGPEGTNQSQLRLVMCGEGMAKTARNAVLESLREARAGVKDDSNLPKDDRKKVLKALDKQIKKLERSIS